ncbi:MAG: YceI family protein, partial [Pseudomonadota bacterium]
AALALTASGAFAAAEKYTLDASHSQILFSYNHLGFSTTWGMFSGFEGEIMLDQGDPARSSVTVSMPVTSMFTGWEQRDKHFMSPDFFDARDGDLVTFVSTDVEVTGTDTAVITGDLSMNGITKPVSLDAVLNQMGVNPLNQKDWVGFNATTTVLRSDFDLSAYAPAVSDQVQIQISIEAQKAE